MTAPATEAPLDQDDDVSLAAEEVVEELLAEMSRDRLHTIQLRLLGRKQAERITEQAKTIEHLAAQVADRDRRIRELGDKRAEEALGAPAAPDPGQEG
jgi:hypothetical protein